MKSRRLIWLPVKIVIGGGLIAFVLIRILKQWGDVSDTITNALQRSPHYLVLGLFAFTGVYVLGNIRWILLLRPHGVHLSFWPTSKLWFIGHFFAQYMPGGIAGGDLIKSYYVATHPKAAGRFAESVSTVVLDRLVGVTGLLGVLLIATVINLQKSAEYPRYWLYALAFLLAAVLAAAVVFSKPLLKRIPLFVRLHAKLPYRDRVMRLYDAFYFYRTRPLELAAAFGLSLLVHATTALEAYLFGTALGLGYTYPEYLLLLSLANFVASIPVSPVGNVGTLEAACMAFFGGAQGLPLAIVIRIAYWLWGIPGLLLYVTHRKEYPHKPLDEAADTTGHDGPPPHPHTYLEEAPAND